MSDEKWAAVGAVALAATAWGLAARRRSRRAVDLGATLVELWASVADVLSAFQEAVSDEAYLGSRR